MTESGYMLVNASDFSRLLKQRITMVDIKIKDSVSKGMGPNPLIDWEVTNWKVEELFWESYREMVKAMKLMGMKNLLSRIVLTADGFSVQILDDGTLPAFILSRFEALKKEYGERIRTRVDMETARVSWKSVVPLYQSDGYFDDPSVFPEHTHLLVDRHEYFHLMAIAALLPDAGPLLVSISKAESLLGHSLGNLKQKYVPRLG